MGFRRLPAPVESLLDEAELLDLRAAVEAMTAGTPLRLHESVALFPVALWTGARRAARGVQLLFVTRGQPQRSNVITSSNTSSSRSVLRHLTRYLSKIGIVIDSLPHQIPHHWRRTPS